MKILVRHGNGGNGYYKPICGGGGVFDASFPTSKDRRGRVQEGGTVTPTITTSNHNYRLEFDEDEKIYYGEIVDGEDEKLEELPSDAAYRIRKLTPKECWRLMDFTDSDYGKAAKVNSETQLYKQAGNSIVVNVLTAIFGQMIEGKENVYKGIGERYYDS